MSASASLAQMYEDLANHFARQGESRQRDQCLVLAADAALTANMPLEAERLRKRLLLTNPNHLLRPYATMSEAMQSPDVRDYVLDLRKQWPPEMLGKLLNQPQKIAHPTSEKPSAKPSMPRTKALAAAPDEPVSSFAYALSIVTFGVGLLLAGGMLFVALWPF